MIDLAIVKELEELDLNYSDFAVSDGEDRNGMYYFEVRQYTFPYNDREEAERDCAELMSRLNIDQ